jgi:hypothetical protein
MALPAMYAAASEQAGGNQDDAGLEVVLAQRPLLIGGVEPLDVGEFHRFKFDGGVKVCFGGARRRAAPK